MNRLRTTPEHLKAQGNRLMSQGESLGTLVKAMISVVDSISATGWSGDAATAYKSRFDALSDDADRMRQLLNETGEALMQIADEYISAEEANAGAANSLPEDVYGE